MITHMAPPLRIGGLFILSTLWPSWPHWISGNTTQGELGKEVTGGPSCLFCTVLFPNSFVSPHLQGSALLWSLSFCLIFLHIHPGNPWHLGLPSLSRLYAAFLLPKYIHQWVLPKYLLATFYPTLKKWDFLFHFFINRVTLLK